MLIYFFLTQELNLMTTFIIALGNIVQFQTTKIFEYLVKKGYPLSELQTKVYPSIASQLNPFNTGHLNIQAFKMKFVDALLKIESSKELTQALIANENWFEELYNSGILIDETSFSLLSTIEKNGNVILYSFTNPTNFNFIKNECLARGLNLESGPTKVFTSYSLGMNQEQLIEYIIQENKLGKENPAVFIKITQGNFANQDLKERDSNNYNSYQVIIKKYNIDYKEYSDRSELLEAFKKQNKPSLR
ncbi:MAG: hypothetical protein JWM09_1290 [Francisellaceae bacterium]|nr:hypothetical protein [Francisellaceae bacterium]